MIAALCVSSASLAQNVPQIFECYGGVVSDKETTIRIAEAILFPVYGENAIRGQRPYQVTLNDAKWTVDGTARPGFVGGSFHVVILQRDARVVEIGYHP
jgi:NTF2 fold immunity protein